MLRSAALALLLALPTALSGLAQDMPPPGPLPDPLNGEVPVIHAFRPLPFHDVAKEVSARYQGQLLAAATRPPRPDEREAGVQLVYEFRVVTPQRNLLSIRVDAQDGRFLEIAGHGQIEARRPVPAASRPMPTDRD